MAPLARCVAVFLVGSVSGLAPMIPRATARVGSRCRGPTTTVRFGAEEGDVEALREQAAALRAEVETLEAEALAQRLEDEKNKPPEPEPVEVVVAKKEDPVVAAMARRKAGGKAGGDDEGLFGLKLPSLPSLPSFGDGDGEAGTKKKAPAKRTKPAEDEVPALARALACAPYILPLSDAVPFGQFVFTDFPLLGVVLVGPFAPFIALLNAIPFGQFICFIVLTTQSRNADLPRFARFSMQQAVLLDISLIFPQLLGTVAKATNLQIPEALIEPSSSAVFFFIVGSILYSCGSNALGKLPNSIPLISPAAEQSIGPDI